MTTPVDPNQVLDKARTAATMLLIPAEEGRHLVRQSSAAAELAEAFEMLDGWLNRGGHLPRAWQ